MNMKLNNHLTNCMSMYTFMGKLIEVDSFLPLNTVVTSIRSVHDSPFGGLFLYEYIRLLVFGSESSLGSVTVM